MSRYGVSKPHLAVLVAVVIVIAGGFSSSSVAEEQNAGSPTLADLMTLTQLRHFKLWYAQRLDNWDLAAYEFRQFETTIARIVKLYPTTSSIAQANLIHEKTDPAMSELRQAIVDKSNSRFESAYGQITSACNQCHQAAKVGFIVIQNPTRSPFSNQSFEPLR